VSTKVKNALGLGTTLRPKKAKMGHG